MPYCDLHRLGPNVIVIEGRELILGEQGDVAQIVLHRQGNLLTLIDSGAFAEDRNAILRAAQQLGDVSRVVLLNSHGHVDHVGNNDVIYELASLAEHYIPKKDYPNLCDQAGFFEHLMDESTRYLDLGSPRQMVEKLMRMFPELRVNSDRVSMIEDHFVLQEFTLGGVSFSAFRVGPVLAIPTEGHTIGHLCFLFPQEGFFYGADEFIGPVAPWGDSSPTNQLKACRLVMDLVRAGVVTHAARGHHWGIVSGGVRPLHARDHRGNRGVGGPSTGASDLSASDRLLFARGHAKQASPLFWAQREPNLRHHEDFGVMPSPRGDRRGSGAGHSVQLAQPSADAQPWRHN